MYKNFIGGKWVESQGREVFQSINPANSQVLGEVTRSEGVDAQHAVEAAAAAFEPWRRTPAPRRAEFLYRAGDLLSKRKEDLARLLTMEMGKVLPEARGDVQEAIDMAYYMAGEGRRRCHYALELSHCHPLVEDVPRADGRQHRRPQAGQ